MLKNIIVDKNQREIRNTKQSSLAFRIGRENILQYQGAQFTYHWHDEFEFTYIYEGTMLYQIDNKVYALNAGDCLFCNSNRLHRGQAINHQVCKYIAITFNPNFLSSKHNLIYQKYIAPIIYSNLSSYLFKSDTSWQHQIKELISQIISIYDTQKPLYEIHLLTKMSIIWSIFYTHIQEYLVLDTLYAKQADKIKAILNYIHQNYAQKLTLVDISRATHLSISDCSHSFKRYLHETIFSYIMRYRIEQSLPLLLEKSLTITDIALSVGFNSTSYYTEIFKRYHNITPKQYQKIDAYKGEN